MLERLVTPFLMVFGAFLFGTGGFWIIGDGRWPLLECAYMTSITLTTVGYGEVLEQMGSHGRVFAMFLMWSGMGVTLYAVSSITAFIVEKDFRRLLREQRMEKRIAGLRDHIIVCGAGKTGFNIVKELHTTKCPCVVIEGNLERLEVIEQNFKGLYYLRGDATDE
ncbi:MAG: potassium channel family protein, partial [Acidobacteriota bacterium]